MFHPRTLAILLCSIGFAHAQAPAIPTAPSNLRVKPVGVNAFLLEWSDNSNNETGWDVRFSQAGSNKPPRYYLLSSPNTTSHVVITRELPGKTVSFQLAAYTGTSGAEKFSAPTSVVKAVALSPNTFGPPTGFSAKTIDDGRIRIAWNDEATSEHGYQVDFRMGDGAWQLFGNTDPGTSFSLPAGLLEPATRYSFRARAFKRNPEVFTAYSNVATATTKPFLAPTAFVAKADGEGGVSMNWKDNSAIEGGYEIQWRSGTPEFKSLGTVSANTSSTAVIPGFSRDAEYEFRIRGFRDVGSARAYTRFSNTTAVKTLPLIKPGGFTGRVIDGTSVELAWTDLSQLEDGYQILGRRLGAVDFSSYGTTDRNRTKYTVAGLVPGTAYEFRVRAFDPTSISDSSQILKLTTKDGFTSDLNPPIFWNTSFLYQIGVSRPSRLSKVVVTGLPKGLSYDSASRKISGTTMGEGVRKVVMTATYSDAYTITRQLVLRIIRPPAPPVFSGQFAAVEIAPGGRSTTSISGRFSDPDTLDARRVSTTAGNFDIILYPLAAPVTVGNFLDYADDGRFARTFFHRSMPDFIVQTGGYRYGTSIGYKAVQKFAKIQNEPGISNVRGTIAMAKVEEQPDSATSEFFVNLSDFNAPNLDYQNEGFTVFGRVAGSGMNVLDKINDLPRNNYTLPVDGVSRILTDVPMDAASAPATMDPDLLVVVKSVSPVPVLRYSVQTDSAAVATAVLTGNDVVITGVAAGTTNIQVKATDLDGNTVIRPVPVTVE